MKAGNDKARGEGAQWMGTISVHEFNLSRDAFCPHDGADHEWAGELLPEIFARSVPGRFTVAAYRCKRCGAVLRVADNGFEWVVVRYEEPKRDAAIVSGPIEDHRDAFSRR